MYSKYFKVLKNVFLSIYAVMYLNSFEYLKKVLINTQLFDYSNLIAFQYV